MIRVQAVVVFVYLCTGFTSSYNIDTSEDTSRVVAPFSQNTRRPLSNPAFFGYDFEVFNNPESSPSNSLIVGAPKKLTRYTGLPQQGTPDPTNGTTGGVYRCTGAFSSSFPFSCAARNNPRNTERGDDNGLSLGTMSTPERSRLVSCTPTKVQVCNVAGTVTHYNPGYCYRSSNNGFTWREDERTREQSCPTVGIDLIFLLDGSGSVSRNFRTVLNWVINVASRFTINDGGTRLGVVQYSHYEPKAPLDGQPNIVTEIRLGQYRTQRRFALGVNRIRLQGYTTYTAHAINYTVNDFKRYGRFDDPETSKVLILVTDGNSSDASELPASANYARRQGIRTYAVGVGSAIVGQLRAMQSQALTRSPLGSLFIDWDQTIATGDDTSDERVYYVEDFSNLDDIVNELQTAILSFVLEGSTSVTSSNYEHQYAQYGFSIQKSKKLVIVHLSKAKE